MPIITTAASVPETLIFCVKVYLRTTSEEAQHAALTAFSLCRLVTKTSHGRSREAKVEQERRFNLFTVTGKKYPVTTAQQVASKPPVKK